MCINGYWQHPVGGGGGGGTLRWTRFLSRSQEGVAILLSMFHEKENKISSSNLGLWFVCPFTIHVQDVHVFHWLILTPLNKTLAILGSFSNNPSQKKKTGDILVTSQISSTALRHLHRFIDLHVFNLFKPNRGL